MNMLYADLSTCHVSKQDMEKIEEQGRNRRHGMPINFTVYEYEEGAFIPLGSEADFLASLSDNGMSHDFLALCQDLRSYGVQILRLDRDGYEDPDLKKFNW